MIDPTQSFTLEVDASKYAAGATPKQNNRVVGYYIKNFNKSKKNYTILEKETLSTFKSFEYFKTIIFNAFVEVKNR